MTTPNRCHEYANEIAGLRRELAAAQAAQRASVARIDELLRDIEQLRGEGRMTPEDRAYVFVVGFTFYLMLQDLYLPCR